MVLSSIANKEETLKTFGIIGALLAVMVTAIPAFAESGHDHDEGHGKKHKMPGAIPRTSVDAKNNAMHIFRNDNKPYKQNGYFLDQEGRKVRMSDLRGKVVLMDFIYSHCKTGHCMYMSTKMNFVAEKLKEHLGKDLMLVSVSFDPEGDDPERLKAFSKSWDADPAHWLFLTGAPGDISDLAGKYGVFFKWDTEEEVYIHNMRTLVLDQKGNMVGEYHGVDYPLQEVIDDINRQLGK